MPKQAEAAGETEIKSPTYRRSLEIHQRIRTNQPDLRTSAEATRFARHELWSRRCSGDSGKQELKHMGNSIEDERGESPAYHLPRHIER